MVGVTYDGRRLATELQDARLEVLGRLTREYAADAIRSGELGDNSRKNSSRK
jgi:hypothetical protein